MGNSGALDRETSVLVEMELQRIIISDLREQQILYLKEVEGERTFPILIGLWEAVTIQRRIKQEDHSLRPMTHTFLRNAIEALDGKVQDVVINNLLEHVYFSIIRIKKGETLVEVDARPSDAIALAVQYTPIVPIYIEDTILNEVV